MQYSKWEKLDMVIWGVQSQRGESTTFTGIELATDH